MKQKAAGNTCGFFAAHCKPHNRDWHFQYAFASTLPHRHAADSYADRHQRERTPNVQTALFPAATDRRAASELMFRVRAHEDPSTLDILQPHFDATLERISQCERVILSQETFKLDLTNP
ncbi:MAG: hypothetical protein ACK5ES_12415, partial [Planctomyces sp.]